MFEISKYRNEVLEAKIWDFELTDYKENDNIENYIPESIVISVMDEIKYDLYEIKDKLDEIMGLTEIDKIKEKINELCMKVH